GSFRSCLRVLILTKICMCESSTIFSGRDEHGGSRRTHPSSQPAHYAVRTRGGCSYKIATPGGKPVASGRGMWARRSRKAYSPGCSAPALRLGCLRAYVGEPVQPREGRAPARPRCSRRARTSSQQVCDAVRTRGGCSYNVTTPEGRAYRALWRPVGSTFPESVLPGVSRTRATPALSARLRRRAGAAPGGTSTSSSAVQQEGPHIEPVGVRRCSHPGRVLLQDYDIREAGSRQPPCSILLVPAQILRDRRFGHGAGTLSLALLILADLVDIGQHLGHSEIEAGRDRLLEFGTVVHRPCQRRRFEDDDIVLGGDLADLLRQKVGALGHHHRRAGVHRVVFQRHRVVGRVGDYHVGLRYLAHHAPLGHFPLQLADTGLDLGLALAVLVLVAHFLLGHLGFLLVVP